MVAKNNRNISSKLYFDYAAATPLDSRVKRAMAPWWSQQFYNPSALYQPARAVRQALESARASVAKTLGAKSTEITFTAGATESINLAVQGVLSAHPGQAVIGAGEHDAVAKSAQARATAVASAPLKASGEIDLEKLDRLINDKTVLVSIQYASNEVGTVQPMAQIAKLIAAKRSRRRSRQPLYFHSDASQAANYLPLLVNRLGVDLLSLNGSKIYGPKYSGGLYVRAGTEIEPLIRGGGQEAGRRGGTENVAGAIGFAKALEIAQQLRPSETKRLRQLQTYLSASLQRQVEGISLNGTAKPRLPNNLNLSIKGVNGETLVHYLDQAGILAATGAACHANSDEASPTLLAIGLTTAAANSSLRLSLGRQTTRPQVDRLLKTLKSTIALLRQQA